MPENLEKRLKRQIHGKLHRFTAIVPLGFEATLVRELQQLGVVAENGSFESADGKVSFTAKITEAWKAVAYSRIANRILMDIASFKAENFRELEKKAAEIPWELFLPQDAPPQVHITCKESRLYHSDAVAERFYNILKGESLPVTTARLNAINEPTNSPRSHLKVAMTTKATSCQVVKARQHDSLRRVAFGSQNQAFQNNAPTQHLYVEFLKDRCTVSLDLAGEELYKRGHQRFVAEAPLKETIAAAMLLEAESLLENSAAAPSAKDVAAPGTGIAIIDPMAGSGTFSLEAAYKSCGLIPGRCRDFALKHQPAFKEATWNYLTRAIPNPAIRIITSDISERAVEIIKHNVQTSPLPPGTIDPQQKDFFSYTPGDIFGGGKAILLLNPPYGKRLDANAPALYAHIGKKLTELAKGAKSPLAVAILAPKGACSNNLLKNCPALATPEAKAIKTSHGGISLNCFVAVR